MYGNNQMQQFNVTINVFDMWLPKSNFYKQADVLVWNS